MEPIKTILFPADLSEASPKIVPYVRAMAEKFNAEVHVLFVARVFDHYSGMGVPYSHITDLEKAILEQAQSSLVEFIKREFGAMPVKPVVVSGYPAEEIIEYAKSKKMDLIIIGTHGRRGLGRILFGSVAEHVVKNAPMPVFIVNPYRRIPHMEAVA